MALFTRFDPPASLRDAPAGSVFYDNWHSYLASHIDASTAGTSSGEFYDASQTDVNIAGQHALVWMAFPRRVLMPSRDDRLRPRQRPSERLASAVPRPGHRSHGPDGKRAGTGAGCCRGVVPSNSCRRVPIH